MPWDSVPWLVGGGAEHSPEVARTLAYVALGGAEGVSGINDCKVQQLATPGSSIRVLIGGVGILNRSTGGTSQAYVGRVTTEDVKAVTANGPGSTRYDLVVARVMDPEYPPWNPPSDPANGPYIETFIVTNVPSTTKTAAQLSLGYPALALARLALPPNTATITNSMITDLRTVVHPRRDRNMRTVALTAGQSDILSTLSTDGEVWPDAASWNIDIPEWATTATIQAIWGGVKIPANGNYYGALWVRIGSTTQVPTQHIGWDSGTVTNNQRVTWSVADDVSIPSSIRGTTQTVTLRAKNTGGTTGQAYVDDFSSISLDLEFLERADVA